MFSRLRPLLLILLGAIGAIGAAEIPDPAKVKSQIDALVDARLASGLPASLGLIGEAMDLADSYGSPCLSSGDAAACAGFEAATFEKLVESCTGLKGTSAETATALQELADADRRQKAASDPAHRAWSLRFAIDQIKLSASIDLAIGKTEIQSGAKYFGVACYEESQLSWDKAFATSLELAGSKPGSAPPDLRIAGILDAQALLELRRIPEAAATMAKGVVLFPEVKGAHIDWHALSPRDHTVADRALADAQAAAQASPENADLAFLVAVEQVCGGHAEDGAKTLAAVLKLVPGHAGALLLSGAETGAANVQTKPTPPSAAGGGAGAP